MSLQPGTLPPLQEKELFQKAPFLSRNHLMSSIFLLDVNPEVLIE
jgi:hypothetical protein